jgi:hypothetical protein
VKTLYRPVRDYRINLIRSFDQNPNEFRTPVEVLEKKYEKAIENLEEDHPCKEFRLIRGRGDTTTKTIKASYSLCQRINRMLPRVKKLSEDLGEFSPLHLKTLLNIGGTSAQKYIDILLASGLIVSNGRSWGARYRWNTKGLKTRI